MMAWAPLWRVPIRHPTDTVDDPPAPRFLPLMFTIIGGDGKEYGPVPANQLRDWIAAGRANLDTQAKAAGSEEWRRVGDYVEFGSPALVAPPKPGEDADPAALPPPESAAETAPLAGRGERLLALFPDALEARDRHAGEGRERERCFSRGALLVGRAHSTPK